MKISIIGTGYVGLVTGVCLADLGNKVTCVDVDKSKVDLVNSGNAPIYEKDLEEVLKRAVGRNLTATTDVESAVAGSDLTFICVGTPSNKDGSTNLEYVKSASQNIGKLLKTKESFHVVVVKSTVPPKTCELVRSMIEKESEKKAGLDFGMISNPEFLREGNAIYDFKNPDRIVIGYEDQKSLSIMESLYSGYSCPFVKTTIRTAELIKYASNSMLATKISFANELGNLCKKLGIDVYEVMDGVGMDKRINRAFLDAGIGFGGSCFPKDVRSLINTSEKEGVEARLLKSVIEVNDRQPMQLVHLARTRIGAFKGKRISVLGLAFKPETDDLREAPAIIIIKKLISEGSEIMAYDPAASKNAKKIFGERIKYASSLKEALGFSEIVFVLTGWKEFKDEKLYAGKIVFDGRKVLNKKSGNNYQGICW